MYYGSGTVDRIASRQPVNTIVYAATPHVAAAAAPGGCCMCTHQMASLS